ncbi:MAG: hypothetical protein SFW67_19630 [Myxococcaceae bacterium]|nr:hypothetical protein [Myxococcaceae bacterium]
MTGAPREATDYIVLLMRLVLLAALALCACRKETPPTPSAAPAPSPVKGPSPTEVARPGAYHAVQCGDVTAVFQGSADDLKELAVDGKAVPKTYGVRSLSFVFADGREVPFTPRGELAFSDWSFDVFSPDCARVALLEDRYGPYAVRLTKDLAAKPREFKAPGETASVHGSWRWTGPSSFEFVASCCGGARVYAADTEAGTPLREVFTAERAPSGVRPTATGWEVAP